MHLRAPNDTCNVPRRRNAEVKEKVQGLPWGRGVARAHTLMDMRTELNATRHTAT